MCPHCILSTGVSGGGEGRGVRVEGGWKSLTGIVVGENDLFGVWLVI